VTSLGFGSRERPIIRVSRELAGEPSPDKFQSSIRALHDDFGDKPSVAIDIRSIEGDALVEQQDARGIPGLRAEWLGELRRVDSGYPDPQDSDTIVYSGLECVAIRDACHSCMKLCADQPFQRQNRLRFNRSRQDCENGPRDCQ
jgi:hypothetical protein